MTHKEKIQKYLELKGYSKNSFYQKTGFSVGFLDSGKSFGVDNLKVIIDNYHDLSLEWLIFDQGDMIQSPEKKSTLHLPQVITVDEAGNENIPLVQSKVAAGYIGGFTQPEFVAQLPTYRLPGLDNATFRMFEVNGNSMLPTLHPNDIVIGEFVEDIKHIRNDRVYVIITKEDLLVKRCLLKYNKLIAKSDNHHQGYEDIVFDLEDILELWYVQRRLTGQLAENTDIYERMTDLEARLSIVEKQTN